ncbi:MAG: restriction endonuclease subunit S, partial [Anaerostipes hadrus]
MKYIKLKDVCKINMGQSPDSSSYNESGEGIPFFQGNADFGDRYPVTRIWCSEPKKVAQENDILISVRAPIGAINYSKEKCCIGRGLAALTVDKTKISEKLLFWVLKAKKEELNRQGTGSTFKAISKKSLEELLIPQIDIKEQEKDVEILEKIYMIIQNKHKELKLLTDLISARFVEMFGTLDNPTQNFQTARLEELCSKITDGKHGGCVQEKGTKRYFVGAREIYDDKIHYDTAPEININEFEKDYKRCNVEIGDFLIVNTGATIGKSAIATDE